MQRLYSGVPFIIIKTIKIFQNILVYIIITSYKYNEDKTKLLIKV